MNIPDGFRLLADDEVITSSHIRARFSLSDHALVPASFSRPVASQIGSTRRKLLERNLINPTRFFLAITTFTHPQFHGWFSIGVDNPVKAGDRLVIVHPVPGSTCGYTSPDVGLVLDAVMWLAPSSVWKHDESVRKGHFSVYRPMAHFILPFVVEKATPKRPYTPHPFHSKALPLP